MLDLEYLESLPDVAPCRYEILKLVAQGYTYKEIAQKLYVTEQTVKSHCNKLFKKFGVTNRVGLALKGNEARTVLDLQ